MDKRYLSVTALNRYLKAKLDSDSHLIHLYIQGELSNVKYHSSGHCYFTLKDEKSRISAVMFSTQLKKVGFRLEDGMKVLILARVSIYEAQGTYQLYVEKLEIDGLGNLFMAYEKLRNELEKRGLFSELHKKKIPDFPEKIGIITAPTGAAIHDITRTISLNCPSAKMFFFPSLVQGEGAANNLCEMVKIADKQNLDVIIIGRGGGSLEDLWAFNNETLAYTIYEAKTPIISGVGHESDVTICDFVADYRAATPTAAAQKATFNQKEFEVLLQNFQIKMKSLCQQSLKLHKQTMDYYQKSSVLAHPNRIYENAILHLDELEEQLIVKMQKTIMQKKHQLDKTALLFSSQMQILTSSQCQMIRHYQHLLNQNISYQLATEKRNFSHLIANINHLNPLNVLQRGYTLVLQNDKVITSKSSLNENESMLIRFKDGDVKVKMEEENHEENEL